MKRFYFLLSVLFAVCSSPAGVTPWLALDGGGYDKLPEIVMDSAAAVHRLSGGEWLGAADLSAAVRGGWSENGLSFRFVVTDDDVANTAPDGLLFFHDAVEIFLLGPEGASRPHLQLIVSAPDENGAVRMSLPDGALALAAAPRLSGRRIAGGYELEVGIPPAVFGLDSWRAGMVPAFQLMVDDHDGRDGSAMQPRYMTINGATGLSRDFSSYIPIELTADRKLSGDSNLDGYWQIIARPWSLDGGIAADMPESDYDRVEVETAGKNTVVSARRGQLSVDFPADLPDGTFDVVFKAFRNGEPVGRLTRRVTLARGVAGKLRNVDFVRLAETDPERAVWWFELLSGIEYLKSAVSDRRAELAGLELDARLALLEDRPLPETASGGLLRLLDLARGFKNQLSVSFRRGSECDLAMIVLRSGNLPLARAKVELFESPEKAAEEMAKRAVLAIGSDSGAIDGGEIWTGFQCWGELPGDYQIERSVLLISSLERGVGYRMTAEQAYALGATKVMAFPDAPEHIVEFFDGTLEPGEHTDEPVFAAAGRVPESMCREHRTSASGTFLRFMVLLHGRELWTVDGGDEAFAAALLKGDPLDAGVADRLRLELIGRIERNYPGIRAAGADALRRLRVGDVHTHTKWSDGTSTPLGLAVESVFNGCDLLVVSDHNSVEGALNAAKLLESAGLGFQLIPGEEITAGAYHLNAYPLSAYISPYLSFEDILAAAASQNAVVQWNHPTEFGVALNDFWYGDIAASGLDATERHIEFFEAAADGVAPEGIGGAAERLPIVGSSDTHGGILYGEYTAILASGDGPADIVAAVKSRNAALVCPGYRNYVYGAEVAPAVLAALRSPDAAASERRARLMKLFGGMNIDMLLDNEQ
ncbi:MAG: hypothetical protein PHI85_06460 [Victivallaceae bacterium]|nr:hypothetical protein [Victivallaceae bacterium]